MQCELHPPPVGKGDGVGLVADDVHERGHPLVLLRDDLLLHLLDGRELVQALRRVLYRGWAVRWPRLAALRAPPVNDVEQQLHHAIPNGHRHHLLGSLGLRGVRFALLDAELEHVRGVGARHGAGALHGLQEDEEVLLPLGLLVRHPQVLHYRPPRLLVLAQIPPRAHDAHLQGHTITVLGKHLEHQLDAVDGGVRRYRPCVDNLCARLLHL
mmetsp:Transcript_13065/g.27632  ORF Transcript_13065/g.27632 Transcript_13065/m.27632 type:complete len:212 (+) Transcript_13065:1277-1912(+)